MVMGAGTLMPFGKRLRIIALLVALAPAYSVPAQERSIDANPLDTSATSPKSPEKGTSSARGSLAQQYLEFGEGHLDRVEVWGVY